MNDDKTRKLKLTAEERQKAAAKMADWLQDYKGTFVLSAELYDALKEAGL